MIDKNFTPSVCRIFVKMAIKEFIPAINCEITGPKPKTGQQGICDLELTFYGLKTCDTCRKAQKELLAGGHNLTVIDVRADGVPRAELARFLALFGEDLVNRRSTTWRGLSEQERARDPLDLLSDHPTLMKRPVIVAGEAAYLGWSKSARAALAP